MNLFKRAVLSIGGSLFQETVLPVVADSYTSGFQQTVKGIPLVGGFLDKGITNIFVFNKL